MKLNKLENNISLLKYYICKMCFLSNSGHPSSSLSCSDIIGLLYFDIMDHKQDKFILSKGHAAPSLYSALMINKQISTDLINELRKIDSPLQGHPDVTRLPQVNVTTGALGQGLSFALGLALARKVTNRKGYIYALIGDGEMQEGQVWESAMFGGNNELNNLIVFLDNNQGQSDGSIDDIMPINPIKKKWESFGWLVEEVDGHDIKEIQKKISDYKLSNTSSPLMVVAKTKKGYINENLTILEGKHGGVVDKGVLSEIEKELKEVIDSI